MEFSKDGTELLVSYHNGLLIWDVASIKLKHYIPFDKVEEFICSNNYTDRFDSSNLNYERKTIYNNLKYIQDLNIYLRYQNGFVEILNSRKEIICKTKISIDSVMNSWEFQRIPKQNELLIIGNDKTVIYNTRINDFTQYFKNYPKDKFFFQKMGNIYALAMRFILER